MDGTSEVNQVDEAHLRIHARKKDWPEVDRICSKNKDYLSLAQRILWIRSLFLTNKYNQCYDICQRVLEEEQFDIEALRFRARSANKIPLSNKQIRSDWKALIRAVPGDPESINYISRTLIEDNRLQEANQLINELIESDNPYNPVFSTITKLIHAARINQNKNLEKKMLESLESSSNSSIQAARLLARELIYFCEDENHVHYEIRRIYSIFGDEILKDILTFCLKSDKIEIIVSSEITDSVQQILDPINGELNEKIGPQETRKMYSSLQKKITKILSKQTKKYETNFSKQQLQKINTKLKQSCKPSYDLIIRRIEEQCFVYDYSLNSSDSVLVVSNNFGTINQIPESKFFKIVSLEEETDKIIIRYTQKQQNGPVERGVEIFDSDPRILLGRFHSLIPEFTLQEHRILSCLLKIISEEYPGEIFFSPDFPEVELATRILGYGEANVKTIDQFTEN